MSITQKKRCRDDDDNTDMDWITCPKHLRVINNDLENSDGYQMEMCSDIEDVDNIPVAMPELQLPMIPFKQRARRRIDDAIDDVLRKYRRKYEAESSLGTMQVLDISPDPRIDLQLKVLPRPMDSLAIIPVNNKKESPTEKDSSFRRRIVGNCSEASPLRSSSNEYIGSYMRSTF
jgi:hypothetical protein